MAINPNSNKIYVLSEDTLSVIDGKTDTVVHTITVSCSHGNITVRCLHVAVNKLNDEVYVASDNGIQVIDKGYKVNRIIPLSESPSGMSY